MKKAILSCALMSVVSFAMAQTHYLYVAGGREIDPAAPGITANDTLSNVNSGGNLDFINVLVANVDVAAKTVGNWRIAGVLPATHPDVAPPNNELQWSYLNDNVVAYNHRLYVGPAMFNGTDTRLITGDFIAYATINSNGSLGTFATSPRFPINPANQRITATEIVEIGGQAYIYVIAGGSSEVANTTNRIIYAPINSTTGAIGAWSVSTTPSPVPDWFTGAVAHGGRLIHAGGNLRGSHSVDHAPISATGNITSAFTNLVYGAASGNRWDYGITKTVSGGNTFMHIIGGTTGTVLDTVNYSQLDNATGTPGAFTQNATNLPAVRRRMTAAAAADMIVVPGGSTTGSFAQGSSAVYIGSVASNGAVTWSTSPNPMSSNGTTPQNRSFHGATIAPLPPVVTAVSDWTLY